MARIIDPEKLKRWKLQAKRKRLYLKECAECGHPWLVHWKDRCDGLPDELGCETGCVGFVKKPGDVLT